MSKTEQTKAFILKNTAAIFNTKGFQGTSLSDLTIATGLTKGSIYGNYANKDEVALAAFDYNFQKLEELFTMQLAKHTTAKNKILAYADIYDGFTRATFPEGGCPILNTAIEADDTHPALKQKAAAALNAWKNNLMLLIEKGKSDKEFNKNTDAEKAALAIIAMLEGGIMIAKLMGKSTYRHALIENFKTMVNNF